MTEKKHTPEPWYIEQSSNISDWLVSTDDYQIARCLAHPAFDEAEANARRIVACVNACEGVDNETLEKIASGEMSGSEIWELPRVKAERDTLAAKVKELDLLLDIQIHATECERKAKHEAREESGRLANELQAVTVHRDELLAVMLKVSGVYVNITNRPSHDDGNFFYSASSAEMKVFGEMHDVIAKIEAEKS